MIQNVSVEELALFDADPKPQSLATASNLDTATFLLVQGYRSFIGIGIVADLTGTVTVQLLQATSAGGAGKKALGSAATEAGTAATVEAIAKACEQDLDTANAFYYVGMRMSHNHGTARDVAAVWAKVPYNKPASN